jgi:hypothetical protein
MAKRVTDMRQTNGTSTKCIDLKMVLRTDQGGDPDASKKHAIVMDKGGKYVYNFVQIVVSSCA